MKIGDTIFFPQLLTPYLDGFDPVEALNIRVCEGKVTSFDRETVVIYGKGIGFVDDRLVFIPQDHICTTHVDAFELGLNLHRQRLPKTKKKKKKS